MNNQSAKTTQTVGVVLVNWNGAEHTIPCIESLFAGSMRPDRIVVVDNASHDGSADRIAQLFPDIDLIRNNENLGYTGANNIGINRLMMAGYDHIWILNNDTTVDKQCLSVLKGHMDAHPDVAACSGKILYAEPENLIWYAGAAYDPWIVRTRHRGNGEADRGQYEKVEAVPFISGCCMFIRREAIEEVGAFDDHFFAYYEDSDWCLRAVKAKQRLEYVPQAVIRHKVSVSLRKLKDRKHGGDTSPFAVYIVNRNRLYLIRKHGRNVLQTGTALLLFSLWACYYGIALVLLGRIEKFRALVMSVHDGLLQPINETSCIWRKPRYLP